jgi:hypothetical protein
MLVQPFKGLRDIGCKPTGSQPHENETEDSPIPIPGGNFSGVPANRETSLPSGQTRYNSLYSWVNVLWHIPPAWG